MNKPDFIIAGERRSGSTTLYDILSQHPEVGMLDKTDFDYFIEPELFSKTPIYTTENLENWDSNHSPEEYESFFTGLDGVIGQKDADLLWWKPAHKRLSNYLPETKFIFVLRDPVRRAESQYFNELGKGREQLSFKKALHREATGGLSQWEKLHLEYKQRGCYAQSLQHFFQYISKERVKVVILEELSQHWDEVMTEICGFLNIDGKAGVAIQLKHSNKEELLERKKFSKSFPLKYLFDGWDRLTEAIIVRAKKDKNSRDKWRKISRGFYHSSKRDKSVIDPKLKNELYNFYLPYHKELETLLDRKIKCWDPNV